MAKNTLLIAFFRVSAVKCIFTFKTAFSINYVTLPHLYTNPYFIKSVTFTLVMRSLRKISSLAFVFLVLFASTNFMMGIHFCGGEIQSVALFGKAEGCPMEQNMPPCHKQMATSCCDNETIFHNAEAFKGDVTQISLPETTSIDLTQAPVLVAEVLTAASATGTRYYNYDPPLRTPDITVALHVFLI